MDPGETPHLTLDAAGGSYDAFQTHALLSGPIIDNKVFGSLAFVHNQQDGTTYDPTIHEDVNTIDYNAARAKVRVAVNDDIDIQLTADGLLDRSSTAYYTGVKQAGVVFNPNDSYSPIKPVNHLDDGGFGMRITDKLTDNLTLKSITSGRAWDQAPVIYDNSGTNPLISANFIDYHQRDYTQELQLAGDYGRVNFVTGLYFFRETFSTFRTTVAGAAFTPVLQTQNQTITDSYAAYGQGNYRITDTLTATLGLRYTIDARDFTDANFKSGKNPAADSLFDEFFPQSVLSVGPRICAAATSARRQGREQRLQVRRPAQRRLAAPARHRRARRPPRQAPMDRHRAKPAPRATAHPWSARSTRLPSRCWITTTSPPFSCAASNRWRMPWLTEN